MPQPRKIRVTHTFPIPNLAEHRINAWFTQAELAHRAGISERTVRGLENGAHFAMMGTVKKIARALALTPDKLLEPPTE